MEREKEGAFTKGSFLFVYPYSADEAGIALVHKFRDAVADMTGDTEDCPQSDFRYVALQRLHAIFGYLVQHVKKELQFFR